MKKLKKVLILFAIIAVAFIIKAQKSEAATYKWPVGGENASETYKEYDYYGKAYTAPYKDGKSGRQYIVNNKLWPNEKYYYASCESHYGMDITGKNGSTYTIVSASDGIVLTTSKYYSYYPGDNYIDRNQRRTREGLRDGGGYGNYIIIQEQSTGRCFLYAHLKGGSIKVKKGDTVKAGQAIATMGSSGDAGHMHLHFEIRKNKASMISCETIYGYHFLAITNPNTNLDPEEYIGSEPEKKEPEKKEPEKTEPSKENPAKKQIPIAPKEKLSMVGDLNGDKMISVLDACYCLSLAKLDDKSDYDYAIYYADVNRDGKVTIQDAMEILNIYTNASTKY